MTGYIENDDYTDDAIVDDGEQGFHGELREIIENARGTDLEALIPQAQALLTLPEESVAALVSAAQSMVGAVQTAQDIAAQDAWDNGAPSPDPSWEKERAANEIEHTI